MEGCLDRHREPHCCLKFWVFCPTYVHYEGWDCCATFMCIAFLIPFGELVAACWTCLCWKPKLITRGGGGGDHHNSSADGAPLIGLPVFASLKDGEDGGIKRIAGKRQQYGGV